MPAVAFYGGRYGERWHIDMVALTHNAVRRQLFDAFTIANALGKLLLDVEPGDLARVYAWLSTLDSFVRAVFIAEDKFVYPLVDTHVRNARTSDGSPVYLPELLSVRGRREAKAHVLELLASARKTRDVATGETPAKINALRFALDQFGANILDYFAAVERFAPRLFKKAIKNGEKEKMRVEKKLFEFFLTQPQGASLAALLMQCIESRSRRAEFINRNIRKNKLRVEFKTHVKLVESTHMQLARAFDNAAASYERRFNMNMFLQHYGAKDAKDTTDMFADMDINYEPGVDDEATGQPTQGVAVETAEQATYPELHGEMPPEASRPLDDDDDDDFVEIRAEPQLAAS